MRNNKLSNLFNEEHAGAVSFEYVVILVIMVTAIFAVFGLLRNALIEKANDIKDYIGGNGQTAIGNGTVSDGATKTYH